MTDDELRIAAGKALELDAFGPCHECGHPELVLDVERGLVVAFDPPLPSGRTEYAGPVVLIRCPCTALRGTWVPLDELQP